MAPTNPALPDAWDDGYEEIIDRTPVAPPEPPKPEPKLSRAERKLQHQQANRQMWEAADAPPEVPIFIQARPAPPLAVANPIKPAMKVLARRPKKPETSGVNGKGSGGRPGDDDPDSEEEERQRLASEFEERKARAAKEREEKQRKYAEARERLFGPSRDNSGSSSPNRNSNSNNQGGSRQTSRPSSRNGGASGRARGGGQEQRSNTQAKTKLYDPEWTPRPSHLAHGRAKSNSGSNSPARQPEIRPIREPKGPDSSGRGGFGFALRGGRSGLAADGTK